jgi:hypothetical protein
MVAADWVTIGVGATTVAMGFVAFVETIYPPDTRKAKRCWTVIAGICALSAIVLVVVQVRLAAKDRDSSNNEIKEQAKQLAAIKTGLDTLKQLTQSEANEPPGKVLAAAAAKILDLDAKLSKQAKQVQKLEKRTDWREIDQTTGNAMAAELRLAGPHTVIVSTLVGNDEAIHYANRIIEIFRSGGWNVPGKVEPEVALMSGPVVGIHFQFVQGTVPQGANIFAAILKTHKIEFDPHYWPINKSELENAEFKLLVGSNPTAEVR